MDLTLALLLKGAIAVTFGEGTGPMSFKMACRIAAQLTLFAALWPTGYLTAQESPVPLETVVEEAEANQADASWLEPGAGMGPSSWDLYTGSVYANTGPVWVQAEGLMWWLKGNQLPAMVTSSPDGTDRNSAGVLGEPGTGVLFGDGRVDGQMRGGFRTALGVRLGHWVDSLMDAELEANLMWVGDGQDSGDFFAASVGDRILARPFFNAQTDAQASHLVAYPAVAEGLIDIETSSDLLSTGLVFRRGWMDDQRGRLDWLAGYRYLRLKEELFARENYLVTEPAGMFAPGTNVDVADLFNTWNEFHGVDLGVKYWIDRGPWTLEFTGKLAVGALIRTMEIDGGTLTVDSVGDVTFYDSGFYALPTNEGRYRSSRFSALPELGFTVRRQITHDFIFTFGYSLLVINNVVRTGDQLSPTINPSQFAGGVFAGPAEPRARMRDSTLWRTVSTSASNGKARVGGGLADQPHGRVDTVAGRVVAGSRNRAVAHHIGGLNSHTFPAHAPRQIDFENSHAHKRDNGVHGVISIAVDFAENRYAFWFADDRCQFVFDAGADPGVAVQVQVTFIIQHQFATVVFEVFSADPARNLTGYISRAVVAAANVDSSPVAR